MKREEKLQEAKRLYETANADQRYVLESLFPELKESEDEKIRKALIRFHKSTIDVDGIKGEDVIAWLKKQGEIDLEHYKDGENEKRKFVGYGFLKCKGDFLSFKEGETYWLEYIGKDNYNVRSDNLLGQTFHIKPVELYTVFCPTTWLEKQGNEPKVSYTTIVETGDGGINALVTRELPTDGCDDEQEPADKVKPKFKVGDWILIDNPCQIESIDNNGNYIIRYCNAEETHLLSRNFCDSHFHLWDIQDAKDGDVLVASDSSIFIFKEVWGTSCKHYIALTSDNEIQVNTKLDKFWETARGVKPSTKEQRDVLLKAMADAEYTFDFESKELKKIKQKPAWSEEDERIRKGIIRNLKYLADKAQGFVKDELEERIAWLESLKYHN